MTEFSCLYLPHGYYFISTVRLGSADEYVNFDFERKSIFNMSLFVKPCNKSNGHSWLWLGNSFLIGLCYNTVALTDGFAFKTR